MNGVINSVTRRGFVATLLSAVAAVLVPGCSIGGPPGPEELVRYLADLLRHHESAVQLGRSYVESDPAYGALSAEQWAAMVLQSIGMDINIPATIELGKIQDQVSRRVRKDFSDETVVLVDGWLLARTEVRLCALVFRLQGAAS